MRTIALIVAAGQGSRMEADTPKQYLPLGGRPLLRYALETFACHAAVDGVRAVIQPSHHDYYAEAASGLDLLSPVEGGETRQKSVLNGLSSLVDLAPERVLIHDAARPLIDNLVIDDVLAALDSAPGAIPALPVADTLKRTSDGIVLETVNRTGLWRAQTPQAFHFQELLAAHRRIDAESIEVTDDAAIAEWAGLRVVLSTGSEENFKVTTKADLARAERFIKDRGQNAATSDIRTGQGFDVHRVGGDKPLILCGVKIPERAGLLGHSDADVGLHALVDAILGSVGEGDIGKHFPPSDQRWKDAPSDLFLRHAAGLIAKRRGRINNVDVTLICEQPKIGPHRDAMCARIAGILDLPLDRVSVKATTTEKLGFTGRGEGIAAQATVTVALPG